MKFLRYLLFVAILAFAPTLTVAKSIQVIGLYRDTAVINIDGQQRLLRIGETSPEGIQLEQADSQSAWLRVDGEVKQYNLSHTVGYKVAPKKEDVVSIRPDLTGLYRVEGKINNQVVTFIVDTGASHIAMNAGDAKALGIDYTEGFATQVETASGIVNAYAINLSTVQVGSIKMYDVLALVIEGAQPTHVLLGMSFLKRIEINHRGTLLQLRQKY